MIPFHTGVYGGYNLVVADIQPATPVSADPAQATEALTTAVTALTRKLDTLPSGGPEWIAPATHFVDNLPTYTPLSLGLVLFATLLLGALTMLAWTQMRKQKHQKDMIEAVSVPLEAFTQVVRASNTSTELLGRRIEDMATQMGAMVESIGRLTGVLSEAVQSPKEQTRLSPVGLSQAGRQQSTK